MRPRLALARDQHGERPIPLSNSNALCLGLDVCLNVLVPDFVLNVRVLGFILNAGVPQRFALSRHSSPWALALPGRSRWSLDLQGPCALSAPSRSTFGAVRSSIFGNAGVVVRGRAPCFSLAGTYKMVRGCVNTSQQSLFYFSLSPQLSVFAN